MMNVNLSASWRQLCCMAYSSSTLSGSEAVACWISWMRVNNFLFFFGDFSLLVIYLVLHPFMVAGYVPCRVWD